MPLLVTICLPHKYSAWLIDLFLMPTRLNTIANPQKTNVKIIFALKINGGIHMAVPIIDTEIIASISLLV